MKQPKSKNIILYLIILSFISIKIFHLLNQKGITWDSAVYIGMGKYLLSAGKIGLWEPSRPLVWPILLGILWKINLNPVIFGRILELLLSVGCIYLTYLIGKNSFNENIGLFSAFFLAFTPTFLFNSSTILAGIPSTFFALLSVFFLLKKRYLLTGLFLSLSFMTRFLQLLILMPIIFFMIYKKNKIRNMLNLTLGFSIITLPYLILNMLIYKNPLYPFTLQVFMSRYTGWIYHQPLQFYFINLLKENFMILFVITGTIIILKQKSDKKTLILGIFLLFFLFFNSIAHKEARFIITFLPYLYLVASYGLLSVNSLIKKKKKPPYGIVIVLCIVWLISIIIQINIPMYNEYPEFTNKLKAIDKETWISNPLFIVNTNQKADELIYYPLYNTKKINTLKEKLPEAGQILIDTCNLLPCQESDQNCYKDTIDFLTHLKGKFKTTYYKNRANCEEFIFSLP